MASKNEAACVCPKCGHCPTCGRSNPQQFVPFPYPVYPWVNPYGTWPGPRSYPYTITVGGANQTSAVMPAQQTYNISASHAVQ